MGADWMGPDNGDAENGEGARPGSMRPGSMRPGSMRPGSMRPDGSGDEPPDAWLDGDEWSADVADLFCERSALVRLGARLVFGDDEINVPTLGDTHPRYLAQPEVTRADDESPRPAANEEEPDARISFTRLQPRDHELAVDVVLPNRLVTDLVAAPDLAWALKDDLARALVLAADRAFLSGAGDTTPVGIVHTAAVDAAGADGDLLQRVRSMVSQLRSRPVASFRSPGWVLDPQTLDALTTLSSANALSALPSTDEDARGRTLDVGALGLVVQDGADGGALLGYPFVVSRAAREADDGTTRIFFASDWNDAWIGVRSELVAIDVSTEARFGTDETVIRAVMQHDFTVRRPGSFIHAEPPT